MKKCGRCGEIKELKFFSKHSRSRDGHQNYCKECNKKVVTEYDKDDNNRRRRKIRALYGITLEEYDTMLRNQDYACAICKSTETMNKAYKFFPVDHCHETNKVRGLLCDYCNVGLGRFRDCVEILNNAINYLQNKGE